MEDEPFDLVSLDIIKKLYMAKLITRPHFVEQVVCIMNKIFMYVKIQENGLFMIVEKDNSGKIIEIFYSLRDAIADFPRNDFNYVRIWFYSTAKNTTMMTYSQCYNMLMQMQFPRILEFEKKMKKMLTPLPFVCSRIKRAQRRKVLRELFQV